MELMATRPADRDRNREYMRERRRDPAYLALNRERARQWRKDRPEHHRIITASRKARQYGVENTLTLAEWLEILEQHENRCAYCFSPFESLDHVVDISRGGANSKENVVPACQSCNFRKGHRTGWLPSIASRFWPPSDALLNQTAPGEKLLALTQDADSMFPIPDGARENQRQESA